MTGSGPDRRGFLGLSAAAAGAALIGGGSRGASAAPVRGGTLTLLLSAEPPSLTALTTTAFNTVYVSAKVTEGLLTYDFDLNPKPQLATSWSISADGLQYTFKLREGVKWHDGKDFTSEDVAYSISTIKEVHPRGRSTFLNLLEIRTPDPHTAILLLSKPAPYLISALAGAETAIVPKHLYDNGTPVDQNPLGNAPVGTGPYIFKEWERGSHILYVRNANYWASPKPYLDQLVVRFITDPEARAIAIENGEVQLAPETPIPYNELDRFKRLPHIGFERRGYLYANDIARIEFNFDRPFFKNIKVRKAFSQVISREVVYNIIDYGFGATIPGPINPNLKKWYVADLPTYPINTASAEKLLDEAGYPRGEDGVRIRLTHDFVPSGDTYSRGAEYVREALAKVGVAVTVRDQDFATYTRRIYTERDFDFAFEGMSNLFDPTVGVQRLYWSKNFKPGVPFSNGAHYVNPKVDALLEASAIEIDPVKRVAQWRQIQELLVADAADINLVSVPEITLYDKRVADHTVCGEGVMGNLADVHFVAA